MHAEDLCAGIPAESPSCPFKPEGAPPAAQPHALAPGCPLPGDGVPLTAPCTERLRAAATEAASRRGGGGGLRVYVGGLRYGEWLGGIRFCKFTLRIVLRPPGIGRSRDVPQVAAARTRSHNNSHGRSR